MVCPICLNQEAQESSHPTKDASVVACPQCGDFTISRRAVVNLETVSTADHWRVSAWVREYMPPIVTPQDIESARSARIPLLHSRAEKIKCIVCIPSVTLGLLPRKSKTLPCLRAGVDN